MSDIKVPRPKFEEMKRAVACNQLGDGYVSETVYFNNSEYVITGSIGSYVTGTTKVWGHRVVDLHKYEGDLKPLTNNEHYLAVINGERERGYNGQKTRHGKRTIVLVGDLLDFVPTDDGTQISLF